MGPNNALQNGIDNLISYSEYWESCLFPRTFFGRLLSHFYVFVDVVFQRSTDHTSEKRELTRDVKVPRRHLGDEYHAWC